MALPQPHGSVREVIEPIVTETYGKGTMVSALIGDLANQIAVYDGWDDDRGGREYMVMRVCWDWMTGGTTAESVARKIEAALTIASGQEQADG